MATIEQWTALGSAGSAAVAAIAAWRTVGLSRRHWLATQSPALVTQVVDNTVQARLEVRIVNAGAGTARGLRFCALLGGQYVTGYAGPNFGGVLAPGEERVIHTHLADRTGEPKVCITCLDAADRAHTFGLDSAHRVERLRHRDVLVATDPVAAFRRRYGSAALEGATKVGGAAAPRRPAQ